MVKQKKGPLVGVHRRQLEVAGQNASHDAKGQELYGVTEYKTKKGIQFQGRVYDKQKKKQRSAGVYKNPEDAAGAIAFLNEIQWRGGTCSCRRP